MGDLYSKVLLLFGHKLYFFISSKYGINSGIIGTNNLFFEIIVVFGISNQDVKFILCFYT
jgi:hypothetical protein